MIEFINKNIRNLKAYHLTPDDVPVKLNQNENPFDWPQYIKDDVADFVRNRPWNRYPDFIPDGLKKALASYTGLLPGNIIAGNGSNEMLLLLLLSLTEENSPVVICQPTFTVYQMLAKGLGRKINQVSLKSDMSYDTREILSVASRDPHSLIIICSPNNPTGTALDEQGIREILETHKGFCVLDQAYVEFGGYNAAYLINEYPNLIITRTFSKALRGAGMRIGYMLGNLDVIREINKIKLPYNINFFSEYVVITLLKHPEELQKAVDEILIQRESLKEYFKTIPFDAVYSTEGNFFLVCTSYREELFNFLKEKGILIRDVSSYPMLEKCLRISVGTKDENEKLKNALTNFFNTKQIS